MLVVGCKEVRSCQCLQILKSTTEEVKGEIEYGKDERSYRMRAESELAI